MNSIEFETKPNCPIPAYILGCF